MQTRTLNRRGALMVLALLIGSTVMVRPSAVHAQTPELRRCDLGSAWPEAPRRLAGFIFLGHTVPDRFGAIRIAVDRVFDGEVPSEVLIVRSCLEHDWFDDGQQLLVAASGGLSEAPGGGQGPLRLWLTQDRAAIWQVGETGRLTVTGQEERTNAPDWLLDLRFVADVVRAVMGEEAPGAEAFQPGGHQAGSSVALPPLIGPVPSGMPWSPAVNEGRPGAVLAVTTWRGGFVALGSRSNAGDEGPWAVWTSPDGITWRESPGKLTGLTRDVHSVLVIADRGGILVAAAVGLHLAIWRSTAGVTWRRLSDRMIFHEPSAITMPDEWSLRIDSLAASRGRIRVAATWNHHDCLDCTSWSAVWTSDAGDQWRRTRPATHAFDGGVLPDTEVVGTARGFVALRAIPGADADDPQCPSASRAWRSRDGIRWRPVHGGERLCQPGSLWDIDVAADPISGSLLALAQGDEGPPVLMRSRDGQQWTRVIAPFPDPWRISRVAVRGNTIVLLGVGPTSEGGRGAVPIVSRDGGTTWTASAGWPALLDELTSVAIGDGIIVAGISFPAASTTVVVDRPR